MENSDGVPDEYVDTLIKEFAYDPIRMQVEEDPVQLLYDRTTLETIWDTNHDAVNPYTRLPFDINRAVPQAEIRQQMSQYIHDNATLTIGLEVIPDYTNVLSTRDMKNLLMELTFHHQDLDFHCSIAIAAEKTGNMNEQKYWKTLWQKFNLLRLYCQYRAENIETFSLINGYEDLSMVVDEALVGLCRKYYDFCDYAKKVCVEVARIVDIIRLKDSDLRTLPEKSVWAFVHILTDLGGSGYMKIQSMVLRIFYNMFFECISYLFECKIFCNCVVQTSLFLLMRPKVTEITNQDLYNGSATLKAGWMKNSSQVLAREDYVDALVNVVIICISRFENLHEVTVDHAHPSSHNSGHDQAYNIHMISMALDLVLSLIDSLVTEYPNDRYSYVDQKKRLQSLDIVKDIVRMVELVLSGFEFMESSHFLFGFNIVSALYKQGGVSVIRGKDVETFRRFLGSNVVDKYSKQVKVLLQGIINDADSVGLKPSGRGHRRPGNRSCDVRNGSRAHRSSQMGDA